MRVVGRTYATYKTYGTNYQLPNYHLSTTNFPLPTITSIGGGTAELDASKETYLEI